MPLTPVPRHDDPDDNDLVLPETDSAPGWSLDETAYGDPEPDPFGSDDPFAPPASALGAAPAVVVDGDTLRITDLTTADPDVVAGGRRADDAADPRALEAWTRAVLAIGARAAAVAAGAEHADAIALRMEDLSERLTRASQDGVARIGAAVDRAADPGGGTLRLAVDQALGRLSADVSALVAGEDAPLREALSRAIAASSADATSRLERALEANARQVHQLLGGPSGPVEQLRAEIARAAEQTRRETGAQIAEVRDLLAEARATRSTVSRSHLKGLPFEDAVVETITGIAARTGAGDTVSATGTETGAAARRTGDAVWRVAAGLTGGLPAAVAIEAKSSKLSSAKWAAELELARRNRIASAAVGVVDGVGLMPHGERLLVLGPTEMVVAWQPGDDDGLLSAVLLLVRTAAAAAVLAGTGRDPVDLAAAGEAIRSALDSLAGLDAVERSASQSRKASEDVVRLTGRLRGQLTEHLGRAQRLLAAPDAPAA